MRIERSLLLIFSLFAIFLPKANFQLVKDGDTEEQTDERQDGELDITKTTDYLNKKIEQLLEENPIKSSAKDNLAAIFNEERSKLEDAVIEGNNTAEAIRKTVKVLDNFETFLHNYQNINKMLDKALQDLNSYETDDKRTLEEKYKALMLLLKLHKSSTLEEAEKTINLYKDFKNGVNKPDSEMNLPNLSDEYKKYFEEILKILKEHLKNDMPEMENMLKEILEKPELLKKLYEALKDISEEDYDEEDFLWDLWSLLF